jgi:hypothetical protein
VYCTSLDESGSFSVLDGTVRSDVWRLKYGGPRSKESSGRGQLELSAGC